MRSVVCAARDLAQRRKADELGCSFARREGVDDVLRTCLERIRHCCASLQALVVLTFALLTAAMACHAVVDIANAFLQVLRSHATWLVFVT